MGNSTSHSGAQLPAQRQHGSSERGRGSNQHQGRPVATTPQGQHPYHHQQPQLSTPPAQPAAQPGQVQAPPPPPWQPHYNYPAPNYYQYPPGAYPPGHYPPGYQYPHAGHQGAGGYPAPGGYPYPAGYPQGNYWHQGVQLPQGGTRPLGPAVEHVKEIQTVRNPVNVKRSSVKLEPDERDPRKRVLCFTFDATVSGRLAVFYVAREGPNCSFRPMHPDLYGSPVSTFQKGLNQKFRQTSDAAVDLSLFPEELLGNVEAGEGAETFPLVICLVSHKVNDSGGAAAAAGGSNSSSSRNESTGQSSSFDSSTADLLGLHGSSAGSTSEGVLPGQALDPSVQAQMTYAVVKRRAPVGLPVEYDVRVVKQRIWVDGAEYDLQEIYGMEGATAGKGEGGGEKEAGLARDESTASDDNGTECVICLSAPRNTTVLPCRHMCMCGECADVLRFQSNKCPICRHTVEGLLQIKISQKKVTDAVDATSAEAGKDKANDTLAVPPPPPPLDRGRAGETQAGESSSFLMGS